MNLDKIKESATRNSIGYGTETSFLQFIDDIAKEAMSDVANDIADISKDTVIKAIHSGILEGAVNTHRVATYMHDRCPNDSNAIIEALAIYLNELQTEFGEK